MSRGKGHNQLSVVMVCQFFEPRVSGAAGQALTLAKMLKNEGIQVKIVAGRYIDTQKVDNVEGIPIIQLKSGDSRVKRILFCFLLCLYLWRKRRDYQIIHCHGGFIYSFAVGLMRKLLRKRSLVKITRAKSNTSWYY
ncbi:glycosyltransferase, partial [Candidatus Sumerlaeota bacterium]|nr:glycosyltransferase [Candidatus Sumerlaeota bacterium]